MLTGLVIIQHYFNATDYIQIASDIEIMKLELLQMVHQISSLNDYFNFGWFEIISYLVFEDKIEEGQVFLSLQTVNFIKLSFICLMAPESLSKPTF